jgi:hypothetical protein
VLALSRRGAVLRGSGHLSNQNAEIACSLSVRTIKAPCAIPRPALQAVDEVERLARGELVGSGFAQQYLSRGFAGAGSTRRRAALKRGRSSARRARAPPCSLLSSTASTSSARAVTLFGKPASLATWMP